MPPHEEVTQYSEDNFGQSDLSANLEIAHHCHRYRQQFDKKANILPIDLSTLEKNCCTIRSALPPRPLNDRNTQLLTS
ncbi:unnamed protein product [Absidia cylindrospora]